MSHQTFMQRCLSLAQNGFPAVMPNPMVGCVIVHEDKIIGEGFHIQFGKAHAEVNAINSVKNPDLLKESRLYVNLEPCSHQGKTPPCADLIIDKKIPHVVIASVDPNPDVAGNGIRKLKVAGIHVETGILEKEAIELNKRFYTFHQKHRPYIILKYAHTRDGYFAPRGGKQQWITNEYSKKRVHQWRGEEQAILVGYNTAKIDNPQLTNRFDKKANPLRMVIDRRLKLPNRFHLLDQCCPTIVVNELDERSLPNLKYKKMSFDHSLPQQILDYLYKKSIQSLIIEGGAFTLQSFIDLNLWDEARIFMGDVEWVHGIPAPKIMAEAVDEEHIENDVLTIYRNN
jgi:diaminohydroxyphosphoribosylaminopyrimidine deaminase/5-amino-6-(5-phosphoribosylamino)uracil reductase